MSELYLMITVADRKQLPTFLEFYEKHQVNVGVLALGRGLASSEVLDYLGLEDAVKAVAVSVVTDSVWAALKKGLEQELRIDIPGSGIVFTVPMGSIGGKRQLLFLTAGQNYEKGEESVLKGTDHELVIVITNQGYTELVMDAARDAGAAGGTMLHACGVGMKYAEKFLGVSLVAEKELILMVVKTEKKNEIMKAVIDEAGLESRARSVVFSLPVTSTAGLRLLEEA